MNRERRKVIGNIFADAAKYTLTAGVISSILSGRFIVLITILLGLTFFLFVLLAYFVTPKDKEA